MTALGLSFLAGLLTCLAPCVLPVLPLIVGSSLQASRFGPVALAFGMILSFLGIGLLLMTSGLAFGFAPGTVRLFAGASLVVAGLFLLSSRLQEIATKVFSPLAARAERKLQRVETRSLGGQFFTGALLGALWSPCTGPTMGATLALGARNGPSIEIVGSMLSFGIGAVTPLLALAYGMRGMLTRHGSGLIGAASTGKKLLGGCMVLVGVLTVSGMDKALERVALDWLPDWLIELSVSV